MTKTIKLFLPSQFHEELLYQYEDKDSDLRKLVFGFLTPLGKQAKLAVLNGVVQARVFKDGKMSIEEKELKEVDLEKNAPKSNPNWIPEKVTKEEITIYEQQISDRLYDDLVFFGKMFCVRLELYNNSLDKNDKDYKDKVAKMPACFEQIIQDNVINQLVEAVAKNIDGEYDEEFEEMEKKLTQTKEDKKPPKRGK